VTAAAGTSEVWPGTWEKPAARAGQPCDGLAFRGRRVRRQRFRAHVRSAPL